MNWLNDGAHKMDLLNETIPVSTIEGEASAGSTGCQLSELELCLVGGGMGDVLQ